jgi:hypothetical protein
MSKSYRSKHNEYKNITRIEPKNSSGFFAFGTLKPLSLDFSGGEAFFISRLHTAIKNIQQTIFPKRGIWFVSKWS